MFNFNEEKDGDICQIIKKSLKEHTSNADEKEFRKSFVQMDFQQFSRAARL